MAAVLDCRARVVEPSELPDLLDDALVDGLMIADRHRCRRLQQKMRRCLQAGLPDAALAGELAALVRRSRAEAARRAALLPVPDYPAELPVVERREEILAALSRHQVIVLAGETGSGKTTQLPKLCLQLGRGVYGRIGHTQPRRIAATSVARRIAEELHSPPGGLVGHQVRFDDRCGPDTLVKLMTDGILLAEIQQDRYLTQYDTLIIDEAHERSLNIDFLLGYLKQLLPARPDLKVVITSATIDVHSFSRHFGDAPVIDVSGRTYPVAVHYLPATERDEGADLPAQVLAACDYLQALERQGQGHRMGDVLVFLPGERDIRDCALQLRRADLPQWDILPLYARLGRAEQERVFDLSGRRGRRVVLATNVAETSLTVPGIRYVIDSGLARISRYSHRSRVQHLPIEPISQASAEQRKGRCGRTAPGICLRLYAEEDFQGRAPFTESEIQRTNLASVMLQLAQLRLGDIERFPFLEPPDSRLVRDGYQLLEELGARDERGRLTEVGKALARLPVDPRIGRMLLAAGEWGCVTEVLIIAAALSLQDPRERPLDKQQAADQAHARFACPTSDFVALVNLWRYFEDQRQALSKAQLRKLCQREFLSPLRLFEWRDLHHQLRLACRGLGLRANQEPAAEEAVHRALLAGLVSHVGQREERRDYRGTRNRRWRLFPGSCLGKKPPEWIMAAELVETGQLYARMCGRIEPGWVIEAAPQLVRRSYSEPHYSVRRGAVMALEKVSLHGLVLSEGRRISYGPIDPVVARELFIRGALVEGQYRGRAAFWRHNQALIGEVSELEQRHRRVDLLVDDEALFRFYDERIPPGIFSAAALDQWCKRVAGESPQLLYLTRAQVLRRDPGGDGQQFPAALAVDDLRLSLSYTFQPGGETDGVSVAVPLVALKRLPPARFEWLVPGMLRDKCIELVKTLPKALRKAFVPVPDAVDRALARMRPGSEPLVHALAAALEAEFRVAVPPAAWQPQQLDPFYFMVFVVLDESGAVVARGRDLGALIDRLGERIGALVQELAPVAEAAVHSRWDFGALDAVHRVQQGGMVVNVYPALVDRGEGVAVELVDNPDEAAQLSRWGVTRLCLLALPDKVKYLKKHFLPGNDAQLQLRCLAPRSALLEDFLAAVFAAQFAGGGALPRDEPAFTRLLEEGRGGVVALGGRYHDVLREVVALHHDLRQALGRLDRRVWSYAVTDIEVQLSGLLGAGFLRRLPLERWVHFPRYLRAIAYRIERLAGHEHKDRRATAELSRHQQRLDDAGEGQLWLQPYRWLLEEYRVSLFAQQLGTSEPVSAKRLDRLWETLQADPASRLRRP